MKVRCSQSLFFKTGAKGNMAEYVLPAVLIGMVALAGLSWSVSGQFSAQGGRSLFQAETSSMSQNGKSLLNTRTFGKNPYLQTYVLTLANGKIIEIPDMPVSVADNIDVDGGHGTTEKLLAALEKIRQALVESGEITEAESQPFKDLANAGHGFGESQAFMENLMQRCGTSKQCVIDGLYQNGRLADIWIQNRFNSHQNALGGTFSSPGLSPLSNQQRLLFERFMPGFLDSLKKNAAFNYDENNLRLGSNFAKFLNSFEKLSNLPVFKQPNVNHLVSKMSQNILMLQRSSFNSVTVVSNSGPFEERLNGQNDETHGAWANQTPDKYADLFKKGFTGVLSNEKDRTFNNSDLTHASSGVICTTGNGSDTGQHCQ